MQHPIPVRTSTLRRRDSSLTTGLDVIASFGVVFATSESESMVFTSRSFLVLEFELVAVDRSLILTHARREMNMMYDV